MEQTNGENVNEETNIKNEHGENNIVTLAD